MTCSLSGETSQVRNVPYGSEMILIMGEPAEMRAFCREDLSRRGYQVVEAANLQHAHTILECLKSGPDLILACTGSDRDEALAAWRSQHRRWPLLVVHRENYEIGPDVYDDDIAVRIRLALEAARPSRSIVIVDENEPERRMVADLLETAGYQVSEAGSAKEASKLLAMNPPELVLTEIVMEDVDGLRLIEDMRKRYPGVAAIAMSGATRADHYLYIARLLGAKGALKKPLSVDELFKLLREVPAPATRQ